MSDVIRGRGRRVGLPLGTRRGVALALALVVAGCGGTVPSASPVGQVSPSPTRSESPTPTPQPTPTPEPTPSPTPTPEPTPVRVLAPLTGLPMSADNVRRNPIAVMIDDHPDARPQSGLGAADVVWHAPAEGGVPRYMAIYHSHLQTDIGPVRSARVYYLLWASELNAVYAHSGGSPKALAMLRKYGQGEYVFDANEYRYGGGAFNRVGDRPPPHNVYTDGSRMHRLGVRLGAEDRDVPAIWSFGPDAALAERPEGGSIKVPYPYNTVTYKYDRETNTYRRGVTGEKTQKDAATGEPIAPKNVVIMRVKFVDTGDSKHRLEGDIVGSGRADIATNGRIVKGTWEKDDETAPTRFFDADGQPFVFTAGQTFIQVVPTDLKVTLTEGEPAA